MAGLEADADRERQAAAAADRKAQALAAARRLAEAETDRRRRREALVRAQVAELDERARAVEAEADEFALERDVLARERDAAKAALEKAKAKGGGYAVMPHKGPNGTWQRPVVIECRNNLAILQPRGKTFTMLDMSPLLGARSSPMVAAVARELMRVEDLSSPDGSPVTPYIYFIVRPDGVRPFYEARGRLEPLGIAFGYELVEQDWEIDFPDLDTWEAGGSSKPVAADRPYRFPAEREQAPGEEPNPFLWPRTRPGGAGEGDDPAAGDGLGDGEPLAGLGSGSEGRRVGTPGRITGGAGNLGRGGGTVPGGRRLLGAGGDGIDDGLEELIGKLGSGTLPPDGMDVTPLLDAFERAGPEGLRELLGGRGGRGAGAPGSRGGLPGVPADRLPDLERPGRAGQGQGQMQGQGPGLGQGSGVPAGEPERIPILPEQLEEDPFENRPPALPSNGRVDSSNLAGSPGGGTPGGTGGGTPAVAGVGGGSPGSPGSSGGGGSGMGGGNPGGRGAGGEAGMPRSRTVQVPLELVVACGPNGVTIHPGGYRLSKASLTAGGGRLARDLETIVGNYQRIDPDVIPRPRLEFLIELGGHETFAEARRQTVLLGRDWPVSIRVAESSAPGVFSKERF